MNGAHLHLILTHLPIVGIPLALLLLLWGRVRRCDEIERSALGALVLLGALTVAAKWTGEGAEEVLKGLPDYPRPWVHEHEEMADKATLATAFLGLLSLAGLLKRQASRKLGAAILAVGLLSSGLLVYTGALGGQIRHTEIRTEAQAP